MAERKSTIDRLITEAMKELGVEWWIRVIEYGQLWWLVDIVLRRYEEENHGEQHQ